MRVNFLNGRSLLSVNDLSPTEFQAMIDLSVRIKNSIRAGLFSLEKEGRNVALLFEKPSTRTRLSLEVACNKLKANPIYMNYGELQLARGESIEHTAKVIGRMTDLIAARVYSHSGLLRMKEAAGVPVVNALSDREHPLQALGDFMTLREHFRDLNKIKIAYVGDGNNVANSLMLAAAKTGTIMTVCTPEPLRPPLEFVALAKSEATKTGAKIELESSPVKAVEGADAVYTDVWVSMGQEAERQKKIEMLSAYQVNERLMKLAKEDALFMHCLPAHVGEEVTEEVIGGPESVVFDQAENRLYTAIAVFYSIL